MFLLDYLIKIFCKIYYHFCKYRKINKNKIVFLSRLSDNKSLDFKLIEQEILSKNKDVNLVFLCRRIEKFSDRIWGNITFTLKCLRELGNSKVCVTDSYMIPISVVKHKKELKIIQIWHSMGAIKKFAYQTLGSVSGRDEKTAKILNMHYNYDYIISGSKEMTKYFSKAFGYDKKYFLNYGLPRIDYLLKNKSILRNKIYKDYKKLKEKKNILYAPTFRTTNDDKTVDLINSIDLSKYNLIIKGHANQKLSVNNKVLTCDKYSALDLLSIADYLITDYSGIAIEAASIDVKTLYYVYDYEKYQKNNGINIDLYKEMKGCVFKDAKDLYKFIAEEKYDMKVLEKYKNKYIDVQDGTSTEKIVNLIIKCLKWSD